MKRHRDVGVVAHLSGHYEGGWLSSSTSIRLEIGQVNAIAQDGDGRRAAPVRRQGLKGVPVHL